MLGAALGGNFEISLYTMSLCMLNTFLIIIVYCSIFTFIAMLCSEITTSTIISIVIFIAMFVMAETFGYIANIKKYITYSNWENGIEYIISKTPNPAYPGDDKVNLAKTICLFIPQGQANDMFSKEPKNLEKMPFCSFILIGIINAGGIYLFSKKELK